MSKNWSAATTWEEVCRRASGRRYWNSVRRFRAVWRQIEVARLMLLLGPDYGPFQWGLQVRIARILEVSEATISRDVAALFGTTGDRRRCPTCGLARLTEKDWQRLDAAIEQTALERETVEGE